MSSLRNAVKRITHKERRQPKRREHLGLLEKKSDYKERATQYHRKQDRIDKARAAADLRNPDEFYFGMHNAAVGEDGYHRKTERKRQAEREAEIGPAAVRIMKQQDLSYIRNQHKKEQKKIEKLQAGLHFVGVDQTKGKHTIFVDTAEEAAALDVADHFDTVPELLGQTFHRPRKATLEKEAVEAADALKGNERAMRKRMKKIGKARASKYAELETRQKRVAALERAEAHLVTERLLAQKGKKRKIKGAERGQPAVYKWSSKRQR